MVGVDLWLEGGYPVREDGALVEFRKLCHIPWERACCALDERIGDPSSGLARDTVWWDGGRRSMHAECEAICARVLNRVHVFLKENGTVGVD